VSSSLIRGLPPQSLIVQRTALLARIDAARRETAQAGRQVAVDLQAVERSRQSLQTGLALLKTSVVAAGVIWSLYTSSRIGRGSRLFTIAVSLLSTIRAMRRVRAFLTPLASSSGKQE
jgi:hypothetical protein